MIPRWDAICPLPGLVRYTHDKCIIGLVLTCGVQMLDETQKLGSFNHLVLECDIFVNEVVDSSECVAHVQNDAANLKVRIRLQVALMRILGS